MDFNFDDLFDFTASTGDWMSIIEGFIRAISQFFAIFGIELFAPPVDTTEPTSGNE